MHSLSIHQNCFYQTIYLLIVTFTLWIIKPVFLLSATVSEEYVSGTFCIWLLSFSFGMCTYASYPKALKSLTDGFLLKNVSKATILPQLLQYTCFGCTYMLALHLPRILERSLRSALESELTPLSSVFLSATPFCSRVYGSVNCLSIPVLFRDNEIPC